MENSIMTISVHIEEDDINTGALEVLKFIRPTWNKLDIKLKVKRIINFPTYTNP